MDLNRLLEQISGSIAQGDWRAAREQALRAAAAFPDQARVWVLLGASRHALGERAAAVDAFSKAAEFAPRDPMVFNALATVLVEEQRYTEALAAVSRAAAIAPSDPATLLNHGIVLERTGQREAALRAYDEALRVDESFVPARLNRGATLMALGRFDEAVQNNERLVALQPDSADAYFNLSQSLLGAGRSVAALAASERAVVLDPGHANAHIDRGLALADLGQFARSQQAFESVERLAPGAVRAYLERIAPADPALERRIDPRLFFLYRGYDRLMRCDWSMRDAYVKELANLASSVVETDVAKIDLPLAYHALTVPLPPQLPLRIACAIGSRYAAAVAETGVRFRHAQSHARLRVGYLSADFCEHLNAYLAYPLLRLHDRDRFEVFAYSIGPDDGADIRTKIRNGVDRFVDLGRSSDLHAASAIHNDGIDVLVDFGGYTQHCRPGIAAFKPSPVQLAHVGFPGTMGAPWIDYRVSDRVATPPAQRPFWREHLIFMPHCFFPYEGDPGAHGVQVARPQYGLAEDAFVFCAHHNSYKIDPEIFSIWMGLLRELPHAVLWLVARDPAVEPNLRSEARARGVDPERLVFARPESRSRYLARYRLADLFLDAPQFTAATTACDALWMGLPLLSIARAHFPSRQAASILGALGMPELVVSNLEDYRVRALYLARNAKELQSLRRRLAGARTQAPMFRIADYVRAYELALEAVSLNWRAGKPPGDLQITADESARFL